MIRSILLLFTLATTVAQAQDWQPEAGFVSLFNGKDLTGWCFRVKTKKDDPKPGAILDKHDGKTEAADAGRYIVRDGVIAVTFPTEADKLTGQIYTVEEFSGDFVLKLEFRASVNADSGVFIIKPQLQCRDYLVAGPYKDLKAYKPQDWNQMEVTVKKGVAHCTCNGEVLEAALALPPLGPIGLEGDRGVMEYRHIQLKKL
ncbi:MAG: DUF1080 domain-containing protein [Verrucomicrobiaceae bacterium]|nr:DUF1080 domain-containing protein [Verrucomicrobiaceae bacterium]